MPLISRVSEKKQPDSPVGTTENSPVIYCRVRGTPYFFIVP